MSNEPADSSLVERAQSELPYITICYTELMKRYCPLIRHVSAGILIDTHSLDDVTQDIMIKVFHGLTKFEKRASFKTWLMTITVNTCISNNRRKIRESKFIQPYDSDLIDQAIDNATSDIIPEEFNKLIKQLNEHEREILTLKFIAELEFSEISDLLHIKLSACKMKYYRAIEKLKNQID